jgi:hypothetical protein
MEEKEFKKYYLQDYVMAKPMSENEARRLFGEPAEQFSEPGYLVEYSNGNKNWIGKADFEGVSRIADSFVDRMNIEITELDEKRLKLRNFVESDDFKKLTRAERALLLAQNAIMYLYHRQLATRLLVAKSDTMPGKNIALTNARFNFFEAVTLMHEGYCVARDAWGGIKFATRQIPCDITGKDIDGMKSLCQEAKDLIKKSLNKSVKYRNQVLSYSIITGVATYYQPTMEDVESDDWIAY